MMMVLGLMSGTSHDGVDAALVSFGRGMPRLILHHYTNYPAGLRRRIGEASSSAALAIARLDYDLGEFYSRTALKSLRAAGIPPGRVRAIASHGQTIAHIPPEKKHPGATMQLGAPAVIASRTGIPVVSDFRAADIAAGGEGAPLVPYADRVLFGHLAPCAVHNIGGISNVTVVPEGKGNMIAFDTGPGGSLMDSAMKKFFGRPYDRGGAVARRGRPEAGMLRELMAMPYLKKRPPKSTGWEIFGPGLLDGLIKGRNLKPEDIMATLAYFTAQSIGQAYRRFVLPACDIKLAVFAGGGTANSFLMELIMQELAPVDVRLSDEFGVPADAREAMSFAILARETLRGRPSNVPAATGASKKAILGSITNP
jgi:anhydro-N-acetylmuramic acid kinase